MSFKLPVLYHINNGLEGASGEFPIYDGGFYKKSGEWDKLLSGILLTEVTVQSKLLTESLLVRGENEGKGRARRTLAHAQC